MRRIFMGVLMVGLSLALSGCLTTNRMQAGTNKSYGYVGMRPLPRTAADLKRHDLGGGLPTSFEDETGKYPFVAENLDLVKGWLDGDFETKRMFMEWYWGLDDIRDDPDPKKNALVRVISRWEAKGGEMEHILICREYRLAIRRGHVEAQPGPFEEDTRILSKKDIADIRAIFRNAHKQGILKHDNYKLIQMVEEPTFYAEDPEAQEVIKLMEGVCYEAHQFNRHWPLETGWSKPEKVIKGAKWTLDQGKEFIFYYGPVIYKSEHYYEFIERDWLYKFWKAGLPKHHPGMHYYLNLFPYKHGRERPLGPESNPHSVLGTTKWLIEEIKTTPPKKSE